MGNAIRTDYLPRGDVTLFRSGAYVRAWTGKTDASRGSRLLDALEAATSGDLVCMGPGTFNGGADVYDVPNGVSLVGSGQGVTTLSTTSGTKASVCPGNSSLIQDITISVGSGGYPLGSLVATGQKSSTGVVYRNIATLGGIDGIIYTHTASTPTFTAYDCYFKSGWDTCFAKACVGLLLNCTFEANPAHGAGAFGYGQQCNGPQVNDSGADLTVIGGKVKVSGGSGNNRGALCTLGVLRMLDVLVDASGTGAFGLVRAGGTLLAGAIATPTGIAPTTSGVVTWQVAGS